MFLSGSTPVSVFPPFIGYQHYPADCVIFSEQSPYDHFERPSYGDSSVPGYHDKPTYGPTETVYIQRTFGFRCMVQIEDTCCKIGSECDLYGNPLSNLTLYSLPPDNGYARPQRQIGQKLLQISQPYSLTDRYTSFNGNCR